MKFKYLFLASLLIFVGAGDLFGADKDKILVVREANASPSIWVDSLISYGYSAETKTSLPADISSYDQIWIANHGNGVGGNGEPTASTRNRLLPFMASGGKVALFCDHSSNDTWPSAKQTHIAIETFVDSVVPVDQIDNFKVEHGISSHGNTISLDYGETFLANPKAAQKYSGHEFTGLALGYVKEANIANGYGALIVKGHPEENVGIAFDRGNLSPKYVGGRLFVFTDVATALNTTTTAGNAGILEIIASVTTGPKTITLTATPSSVNETNNNFTQSFKLNYSEAIPEATTIDFQIVDGTAKKGIDYSTEYAGNKGTLSYAADVLEKEFRVTIHGDYIYTGDRSFKIAFSNENSKDKVTLLTDTLEITIVEDDPLNRPPTAVTLSSATILENQPTQTVVATLSTVDPNTGDSFTYTMVNDAGGFFAISGDKLVTTDKIIDYEIAAQQSFSITVRSTDAAGELVETVLPITTLPVNDNAPTQIDTTVTIVFGKATVIKIPTPTDIDIPVSTVVIDSTTELGGIIGATTSTQFGVLEYLGEGSYSYTPNMATLETTDEFTYQLLDSTDYDAVNVWRVTAKIILALDQSSKDDPIARDDSLSLDEGGSTTINVMADNGFGVDTMGQIGDALTGVELIDEPDFASAFELKPDGSFTYTHDDSENFRDLIRYKVNDAGGRSGEGVVYIIVNRLNDNIATIASKAVTVQEDSAITINAITAVEALTDVDIETVYKVVAVVKDGSLGSVTFTDSSVTYTQTGDVIVGGLIDTVVVSISDAVAYDTLTTHLLNDTIFVTISPSAAVAISASYYDSDDLADGIVDRVEVQLDRPIDIANTIFTLTWADSSQIVTPIPTIGASSSELIFDDLYADSLAKVKTSGVMTLHITHTATFGGGTASTIVTDRAAPVIVSAQMGTENETDTILTLTFSEDIATVAGKLNFPYSFFDQNRSNTPFTMDLVYQVSPTANSIKYLASNISIDYVVTGDSVAIELGNYIYDLNNNEQIYTTKTLLETSFKYELGIRLMIYPQPLELEVVGGESIRTKNINADMYEFYNLDEIGIPADAGALFIIEASGPLSIEDNHRGKARVLDNLGNSVSQELTFKFVAKENGNLVGVAVWDAKNRSGRIVGRGTYLVTVDATLIFADDAKKRKKLVKTIGVKY
jgi:hypothetical protein